MLQQPATGSCLQPVGGTQESVVHTLASSQLGGGPPLHVPTPQVSPVVHASPSLHGSVLFTCVQPVCGLHPSSVQTFW